MIVNWRRTFGKERLEKRSVAMRITTVPYGAVGEVGRG